MTTNREMFKRGVTPCEWNPNTSALSRLSDLFHSPAVVAMGQTSKVSAFEDRRIQVCLECSHDESAIRFARSPGSEIVRRHPLNRFAQR
jgi:hypothetical protein